MSIKLRFKGGTTNLLRSYLGYMQVYDPSLSEFLTYSQAGDFSNARRSGDNIVAAGPNTLFPAPSLRTRKLTDPAFANIAGLLSTSGQSNNNGAGTGASGGTEALGPITVLPAIPDKLYTFNGGFNPHQLGVSSPNRDEPINSAQYASLVPLKGGINIGLPVNPVRLEAPDFTTALTIAMALPSSSSLTAFSWASGSSSFEDVVGRSSVITSLTWADGVATLTMNGRFNTPVGENAVITNAVVSGYNGTFEILSNTYNSDNTSVVLLAMADPGNPTASTPGNVSNPNQRFQDALAMVGYWADSLVEAGKTPRLLAHTHLGHEGNTEDGQSVAISQYAYLRERIDELGYRVNPSAPAPKIIMPAVSTPRLSHTDYFARAGSASESQTLWREIKAREGSDPDFQTCAMYFVRVANDVLYGTPHSDRETQPLLGAKMGNLILDLLKGEEIDPPTPNDDFELIMDAPTVITGTLPYEFEVDDTEVDDPGTHGVQVFNAASPDGVSSTYTEVALDSVTPSGTDLTVTASATIDPRRVKVTGAYATASVISAMRNAAITNVTYVGGTSVEVTFADVHGQTVGSRFAIVSATVTGESINGFWICSEVVDTTTLRFLSGNPGTWTPGTGRIAVNGSYGNGRTFGNRSTLRKAGTARHYCPTDGSPRHDYMLPFHRSVTVRASVPGLLDQINQIGAGWAGLITAFPTIYDFADSACVVNDAATSVVNLGSRGATENMTDTSLTLVGTAGSESRLTYFNSASNAGRLEPSGTPTTWANAHKAGQAWHGIIAFRYKTGAQAQYFGTTGGMEGTGAAEGVCIRVTSGGVMQFLVKGASNVTVFAANTVTLVDDTDYVVAWSIKDGESSCWYSVNGVRSSNFSVTYSNPSTSAAQFGFRIGTSGSPSNRRLVTDSRLYLGCYGDGTTLYDYTDFLPLLNSISRRMSQDVY